MSLKAWLEENRDYFLESDLKYLLKSTFPYFRPWDLSGRDHKLSYGTLEYLNKVKTDYARGIPVAYILGHEEFFGLEFIVTPDVLVPRKETELLVEKALEIISSRETATVLDMGCGCGSIAISIKKNGGENLTVYASDISGKALDVTMENAGKHSVAVNIVNTDLFEGFSAEMFDLIISNPPYVESSGIKGNLRYEPVLALDGGIDGLDCLKRIIERSHVFLRPGGFLILEIGYNQKTFVEDFINSVDEYRIIEWIEDYSRFPRGVVAGKI